MTFTNRLPSLKNSVFGGVMPPKSPAPVSNQQFFHGTTANLQPGDRLLPSAHTGKENYDYSLFKDKAQRTKSVFSSTNEASAWAWADSGYHNRVSGNRPAVYRVQPIGGTRPDVITNAVMSPSAQVQERIDIPPPAAHMESGPIVRANARFGSGGVQGTLPPINWNQFGQPATQDIQQESTQPAFTATNPNQGQLF